MAWAIDVMTGHVNRVGYHQQLNNSSSEVLQLPLGCISCTEYQYMKLVEYLMPKLTLWFFLLIIEM